MKKKLFVSMSLAAALAVGAALAQSPTPTPEPTTAPAASAYSTSSPTPSPTPSLVDNVIKLWKANLSEDFVKKYVATASTGNDLSATDIVRLRDAGLPESVILEITAHNQPASAATAGTPTAASPAAAATPRPAPVATTALAAQANRKWEGLVRRNGGVVLLKSRWDVGTLEFKEETIRWVDAKDPSKNLLIPIKQVTEQHVNCLKKAGGNECFEWFFTTKGEEYRFRDVSWQQKENAKSVEIYEFFKAIYPNLINGEVPVDGK